MQKNHKFGFELYDGSIIIKGKLNGTLDGKLLLDTGADVTVIAEEAEEKLNLKVLRYHEGGVAGGKKIRVPLASLKSLAIGPYSTPLPLVAIADVNSQEESYGEIAGIIGSDFLRHFAVTIDYKQKTLIFEDEFTLAERLKSGTKVPLNLVEDTVPYLKVIINHCVEADYKLDTGAALTFLRLQDLHSAGLKEDTPGVQKTTSKSAAGDYTTIQTRIASFSVGGGLEVEDLMVKAYESEIGFIGANYLGNFAVTLNYQHRYAIFKRN